jgi:tRNA modification GTPase
VREIARVAVAAGARPAERGEMTLRAFLNGRLDLAQAEAVLDAVQARTAGALGAAVQQIDGALSRPVAAARAALVSLYAHLDATIDFAEDDVPPPSVAAVNEALSAAAAHVAALLSTARAGRLQREGMRVAIVGRPNAGKSSLLNALLQQDRAIVTPIPGTTRDVIEEAIDLDGIPTVLADTAGIGETDDPVEQLGIARSRAALAGADVGVFVVDGSTHLSGEDATVAGLLAARDGPAVAVVNKADLPPAIGAADVAALLPGAPVVQVCALRGTGLDALRAAVRDAALGHAAPPADGAPVVTSARHRDALERALQAIHDAERSAAAGAPADFLCIDLRGAVTALGEITGESVTDDVLESIFSRFCIGK